MAGLNATERKASVDLIRKINSTGVAILTIEHNMDVVMNVSKRVVVLVSGKLLTIGTPEEVITEDFIHMLYEVDATVKKDEYGMLNVTYHPLHVKK